MLVDPRRKLDGLAEIPGGTNVQQKSPALCRNPHGLAGYAIFDGREVATDGATRFVLAQGLHLDRKSVV